MGETGARRAPTRTILAAAFGIAAVALLLVGTAVFIVGVVTASGDEKDEAVALGLVIIGVPGAFLASVLGGLAFIFAHPPLAARKLVRLLALVLAGAACASIGLLLLGSSVPSPNSLSVVIGAAFLAADGVAFYVLGRELRTARSQPR